MKTLILFTYNKNIETVTTERIKEIQDKTPYPESVSVQQALLQVWNECEENRRNDLIIFLDALDKRELCRTKSMYFIPLKDEFVDLNKFRLTNTNNEDLKFRYKVAKREFGEGVAYLYMTRCV